MMRKRYLVMVLMPLVMALSCKISNTKKEKNNLNTVENINSMNEIKQKEGTLDSLLNIKKMEFAKMASDEKKQVYAKGIEAVNNSGILEMALNIGDTAPDFVLNNVMNQPVGLYNELKKGPVILTWYRGGWCPYCNITLNYLQQRLPDFKKAGASLIALTPELPDQSLSTAEKHNLEFTVLSDVGNKIGKQYGLVFQLTPEVASIYQESFDLHRYNGNESNELPLPATYVIDQEGIIRYAFIDPDYRNRAEPDLIIKALSKIKTTIRP